MNRHDTLPLLLALLFAAAGVLLCSLPANAAESPKPARCSFMYINGDLVVTCPKGTP
jgi:hypothetical protein